MDIAVIGSNMIDLVTYTDQVPQVGETLEAKDFAMACGGKGANQAVAAARLGAQVGFVSKVGTDEFANTQLASLQSLGVETQWVTAVPRMSSGVAQITVDGDGNNRILIVPGANQHLSPADIDAAAPLLEQVRLMVLQLEVPLPTVYYAIDTAHKAGIPVILNPAPATPALDLEYACRCDYFVPNETELSILTDQPVHNLESIQTAAATLMERGLQHLIVTLGAKGALHLHDSEEQLFPAQPVTAIDSTGAGDAFIGALAQALIQDIPVADAIARAVRYASHSVTRRGTQTAYASAAEFAAWSGR